MTVTFPGCIDGTGLIDCPSGQEPAKLTIKPATTIEGAISMFMAENGADYNEDMSLGFKLVLGMKPERFSAGLLGSY